MKAFDLNDNVRKTITAIRRIVTGKTMHTKNREPLKFFSFEDTTSLYETVFFPKVYHQFCHMLNEMRPYILKGKVDEDFASISLTVSWLGFLWVQNKKLPLFQQGFRFWPSFESSICPTL